MRYTQVEKMEIIRLVETSEASIRHTLQELGVPRRLNRQQLTNMLS